MSQFPSLKAKKLLAILTSEPLNYRIARQRGSHRVLTTQDRPTLVFAFHDGATIAPGLVRKILVKDIGLDERDALKLL